MPHSGHRYGSGTPHQKERFDICKPGQLNSKNQWNLQRPYEKQRGGKVAYRTRKHPVCRHHSVLPWASYQVEEASSTTMVRTPLTRPREVKKINEVSKRCRGRRLSGRVSCRQKSTKKGNTRPTWVGEVIDAQCGEFTRAWNSNKVVGHKVQVCKCVSEKLSVCEAQPVFVQLVGNLRLKKNPASGLIAQKRGCRASKQGANRHK